MADKKDDILSEFAEFLEAKRQSDAQSQDEDEEIEVWLADGRGTRARKSRFKKSVLDELGIGTDPDPEGNSGDPDDSGDGGSKNGPARNRQSQGTSRNATRTESTARKYFSAKAATGKK